MPKDEFDFDDPLELNGVGLVSAEDTTAAMTECFVEEFMRLGYNGKQILAMFRNRHYLGMNMALEKRGERFVRDTIAEVFAQRGKTVTWADQARAVVSPAPVGEADTSLALARSSGRRDACPTLTDPTGAPIPELNP